MSTRARLLAALAVVFAVVTPQAVVAADPPKKGAVPPKNNKREKEETPDNKEAPMTKNPIKLVPEGMKWGMAREDLEKLVDKFIDADYKPKYKEAGASASKLRDLDAEVAAKKAAFKRSAIDLVPGPSGLDANPIANEFTKGNGEMLMSHQRGPGVKIWFFFIGGRLWKTLEEVTFTKGGLYGEDIGGAVKMLVDGVGGTLPRHTPANPDKQQFYDVYDWNDKDTHMRIWDRHGTLVIVREERTTVANLGNLRKASAKKADAIDPSVAAFLRGEPSPASSAGKK